MLSYHRVNLDGVHIFMDTESKNICESCGYSGYAYGEYGDSHVLVDEAEVVCPRCYSSQYFIKERA